MPNVPLNGFLTRTLACESYDISDRSIGRYLKRAMLRRDEVFLKHFKLATLDDQVIEGPQVNLPLISQLTDRGQVPTWYVSSEWLERNFDPRGERPIRQAQEIEPPTNQPDGRGVTNPTDSKEEIIALLKKHVEALESDKEKLEQEKKEMREDARETRKLMNQMQQLMAHMQTRLLPETAASRPRDDTLSRFVVQPNSDEQEEGIASAELGPRARQERTKVSTIKPRQSKPRTSPKQPAIKPTKAESIWTRDLLDFVPFRRR